MRESSTKRIRQEDMSKINCQERILKIEMIQELTLQKTKKKKKKAKIKPHEKQTTTKTWSKNLKIIDYRKGHE